MSGSVSAVAGIRGESPVGAPGRTVAKRNATGAISIVSRKSAPVTQMPDRASVRVHENRCRSSWIMSSAAIDSAMNGGST